MIPGSKRGKRLLSGCERIRKLISQLPESHVTIENMTDAGDINLSLRREELASLSGALLERFQSCILDTICSKASLAVTDIAAVEILGGGVRMQIVQSVITNIFTQVLSKNFGVANANFNFIQILSGYHFRSEI